MWKSSIRYSCHIIDSSSGLEDDLAALVFELPGKIGVDFPNLRDEATLARLMAEYLDAWTRVLNIGAMPVAVALIAIALALARRQRSRRRYASALT